MLSIRQFDFVIWGIRNGFNKNLLSSNQVEEINVCLNDGMRQICNEVSTYFYSIEKTANYSLLTIYNPDTKDHVQRKAYIAITLFTKKENNFLGDVVSTLNSLMNYYVEKQGSALVNTFTEQMFEDQMYNLRVQRGLSSGSVSAEKTGYIPFTSPEEIEVYFKNPSINGYNKVFFWKESNNASRQLPSIERVYEFKNYFRITLINYSSYKFSVTLNGKQIPPVDSDILEFYGSNEDIYIVTENKTGKSRQLLVYNQNQQIDLSYSFSSPKPPIHRPQPSGENNYNKIILLSISALVVIGAFFLVYKLISKDNSIANVPVNNTAPVTENTAPSEIKLTKPYDSLNSEAYTVLNIIDPGFIYKGNGLIYFKMNSSTKELNKSTDRKVWLEIQKAEQSELNEKFNKIYFKLVDGVIYQGINPDSNFETKLNVNEQEGVEAFFKFKKFKVKEQNKPSAIIIETEQSKPIEKNLKKEPEVSKAKNGNSKNEEAKSKKSSSPECDDYCARLKSLMKARPKGMLDKKEELKKTKPTDCKCPN